MFKSIKELLTKNAQSPELRSNSSFVLNLEPFDPKTAVVPGPMIERPLDYYVFCMDPKASDNKNFLYYKKVYCKENTLADAKRTLAHLSTPYSHIIVSYDSVTEEIQGCSSNQVELVKTRIKEFNSQVLSASGEALSEFIVRPKKD